MKEKLYVGQRLPSKSYGYFIVQEVVSATEVYVKFENSGGVSRAAAGNLKNGLVRDNLAKTVYGVGCLGEGLFKSRHPNNGPCTKEYGTWSSMMFRCYGDKRDVTTTRNYGDCSVVDVWHNFQNFATWCQSQPTMLCEDSTLDKDIRVKGNKVYSPDTCCFVPAYINVAVTGIKHQNSSGKAGVWKFKDSYVSEITMFSVDNSLGVFSSLEHANYVRCRMKEAYIGALADVFRDRLDADVYSKLKFWDCEADE